MTGRPSGYTDEIADTICGRLADGESLKAICSGDDMPSMSAVFRWLQQNQAFREMYAYAREMQGDAYFEDVAAIADSLGDNSTSEQVQAARVKIDAKKWAAGKLRPRKYGDRQFVQHGEDPDNPMTSKDNPDTIPTHELEARVQANRDKDQQGQTAH